MKKILSFFAITASIFCGNSASAKTNSGTVYVTCPAGFFCTSNGQYYTTDSTSTNFWGHVSYHIDEIPTYMYGPAELVLPGWGMMSEEQFCDKCNGQHDSSCAYCADEYDETWVSTWFGFYGAKNGEITYHSWRNTSFQGVFPCPGTYPSSENGASSVLQCYRTTSNGQKEYYKAPNKTQPNNYNGSYNTDDVNALLTNLQAALTQANTAANNLQALLKKSNNKINIKLPTINNIQLSAATTIQNTSTTQTTTIVSANDLKSKTNTQTTNQNTTGITESTSDNTQSSTNKKLDFGNLSSTFTNAKVAKTVPTRSAIPQKNSATMRSAKTLPPTRKQVRENTTPGRPTQTKERPSTLHQHQTKQ